MQARTLISRIVIPAASVALLGMSAGTAMASTHTHNPPNQGGQGQSWCQNYGGPAWQSPGDPSNHNQGGNYNPGGNNHNQGGDPGNWNQGCGCQGQYPGLKRAAANDRSWNQDQGCGCQGQQYPYLKVASASDHQDGRNCDPYTPYNPYGNNHNSNHNHGHQHHEVKAA
jgi:hypothetical protein